MLEEMKVYAEQALHIKELEDLVEQLKEEIVAINEDSLPKEYVKSWFKYIGKSFISVEEEAKADIIEKLGEK